VESVVDQEVEVLGTSRGWLVAALTAVSVVVGALAGTASAHALQNVGAVYDNGSQCVRNHTFQDHSFNAVIVTSLTDHSFWFFPPQNCTYSNPKPDGYLAAMWTSYKWGFNANAWLVCGTQGYEFGGGESLHVGRGTTGCGAGWYGVMGAAYVYNDGWRGGSLWTGYEWLTY
jgi:hypothetical protein